MAFLSHRTLQQNVGNEEEPPNFKSKDDKSSGKPSKERRVSFSFATNSFKKNKRDSITISRIPEVSIPISSSPPKSKLDNYNTLNFNSERRDSNSNVEEYNMNELNLNHLTPPPPINPNNNRRSGKFCREDSSSSNDFDAEKLRSRFKRAISLSVDKKTSSEDEQSASTVSLKSLAEHHRISQKMSISKVTEVLMQTAHLSKKKKCARPAPSIWTPAPPKVKHDNRPISLSKMVSL